MLILLRFMETHGVALGYVGDKIRYIRLIRVRFTAEFFCRTRIYRIDADEIKYQYIKIQKYIFLCFFLIFIY